MSHDFIVPFLIYFIFVLLFISERCFNLSARRFCIPLPHVYPVVSSLVNKHLCVCVCVCVCLTAEEELRCRPAHQDTAQGAVKRR